MKHMGIFFEEPSDLEIRFFRNIFRGSFRPIIVIFKNMLGYFRPIGENIFEGYAG